MKMKAHIYYIIFGRPPPDGATGRTILFLLTYQSQSQTDYGVMVTTQDS